MCGSRDERYMVDIKRAARVCASRRELVGMVVV